MKFNRLMCAIIGLIAPRLVSISAPPFIGALPDPQSLALALSQLSNGGQSSDGGVNFQASAGATLTISSFGNLLQQLTNGGAVTVTFDSAYNLVNNLTAPNAVGEKFTFNIQTNAGTTVATPTLLSTDVTLAGTTTVLAAAMRWYQGVITQIFTTIGATLTSGSTFTSITQIGTSNLFTVALATNAVVPVVGTAFYMGVTAGTLPAGWYPIVKVTSATSFVIATPLGTVWTATAVTLVSNSVAPSTYAPLVTITGLMATVTATMSV